MTDNKIAMTSAGQCEELLDDILRELEMTKSQSNEIANKLNIQTTKMNTVTENVNTIDHETDISTWHLKYIKATFGKVYKKIHSYPVKTKLKSVIKLRYLKSKILQLKEEYMTASLNGPAAELNKSEDTHKSKLDDISNVLNELKNISVLNGNELDKQNNILEYHIDMTELVDDKIFKNSSKIKDILK